MDIAFETDKLPSELNGRIKSRAERGGEVVIAHMWAPTANFGRLIFKLRIG
jgi:hypothetical protein